MDPNENSFSLEAILEEYRGFDPEQPEATPLPEAAFMTHEAEITLIEPDEPESPAPEPEEITELAPIEPEAEPLPETEEDAEEEFVREYHPHAEPEFPPEEDDEEEEGYTDRARFARLRGLFNRMTVPAEPAEAPDEIIEEDLPLEDEPQEPTQVFRAVAEAFGEDRSQAADPLGIEELRAQLIRDDENQQYAASEDIIFSDDDAPDDGPEEPEPSDLDAEPDEEDEDDEYEYVERRSFRDAVIRPVAQRIAAISYQTKERRRSARAEAAAPEDLGPEPSAKTASKFYGQKISALRRRGRMALVLSLVLLYITAGLPTFGLLRSDAPVTALVCLILLLTVMLLGLDILTAGLLSLVRRRPGAESLVALGCVFSALDAVLCAATRSMDYGLPYCAVAALAMTFSIYSAKLTSESAHLSFLVLSRAKDAQVLSCGQNRHYDGLTLRKTKRSAEGFVHRTEEPGPDQVLFAVITPYLIVLGVVLSVLATVMSGSIRNALHVFSAIFCTAIPFAALIVYTLPTRAVAKVLQPKGLALAGWSGASDIGRSKRFVVTDQDLFGENTITISRFVTVPGMSEAKVVAYAASVVSASGCCLAPAFRKLRESYTYPPQPVEEFLCEQSGGISGYIHGEEVLFGTSEFLRLKRLKAKSPDTDGDTKLYVAINGEIVGRFEVNYQPMRSVQNALHYLLKTRMRPVFAVRDPNISPSMLRQKFQTQADGFDFPPFQQRYALSDPEVGQSDPISGIVGRSGLAALLAINQKGQQLYQSVRIGLWCVTIVLVVTMLVMFGLCAMGDFSTMSAFHLAIFELIFSLSAVLVGYFAKR